ncbi:nuclear transport factor 2 family protein [Sphaerisporangium rufum]|nr:nuclear transport factor 2 family protein [Sphaerisporangium rufum]
MERDEPMELEEQGWRALATSGETAAAFYQEVLDREVVMLLPGGLSVADRGTAVKSMSGPPWASYELDDMQVRHPAEGTALVTYGVVARRDGSPEYSALMSSLYVRRPAGWRLAFHQQTPR